MRVDCGRLDPAAVIGPDPGEWYPRMPERLDEEELADWRARRDAIYQLAALTVGALGRDLREQLGNQCARFLECE